MSASTSSAARSSLHDAYRAAKVAVSEALDVSTDAQGEVVVNFPPSRYNALCGQPRTSPFMALEPHLVAARDEITGKQESSRCSLKEEASRLSLVAVLAREIWPDLLPEAKTAIKAILCVEHPGRPKQRFDSARRSFKRWTQALEPLRAQLARPDTNGPSTLDAPHDDNLESLLPDLDLREWLQYEDGHESAPGTSSAGDEVACAFLASVSLESPDDSGDDVIVCGECSREPPNDEGPPDSPDTPTAPSTPSTPTGGDADDSGRSLEPSADRSDSPEAAVAPPAFARCARDGCPCEASYNGVAGEYCCLRCRGSESAAGVPCTYNRHRTPREKPVVTQVAKPACVNGVWACTRKDCPCTASYNGRHGEYCCQTCKDGKKCEANYHSKPQERAPKGRRRG